jgi:hypothetical protein
MNHRSAYLARRLPFIVLAPALSFAMAACGNVTVGGFSQVSVDVSGDAAEPVPQPTLIDGGPALSSPSPDLPLAGVEEPEGPEGEVEIDIRLALVSETGDLVRLGGDDVRIKLDLQGVDEAEAVSEIVPAGRYTALRISFTHIQVEVEGGLVIDGEEITGDLHIALEDPELVVSRPLDVEAVEGSRVELLVDLNSAGWLAAVNPVTRTIDGSVFAGLIALVVR